MEMAFEGKRFWDMNRRRNSILSSAIIEFVKLLVPMLDLRGAEPKYVFARVNYYRRNKREGVLSRTSTTIGAYPYFATEWFSSESRSLI